MRIPQIQGLRALAAILVTLFHARLMPGGFIGVDIFYVISGFLITGLILREIDRDGKLDLPAFYQRRIKRLLPTSAFVLICTALISWIVLPAITRNNLGKDLIAASLYVSNYLFAWWQNDYQNLDATPSPVIHYWSLAVEEQFYLVWPIFILALAKLGKRIYLIAGISFVTGISLLFSIYQTETSPIWAFYGLPTRAWELGLGSLLLFVPPTFFKSRLIPWIAFVGIIFSSIRYDENTAFPGWKALLPVLATLLFIASINSWPPIFNDLSNNRISQWLGAISYPLYLWHWPALVIPSALLGRPLHLAERFACIALTILLAHLTHRYVEQPLRHKEISPRKIYQGAISVTLVSALLSAGITLTSSDEISIQGVTTTKFSLADVMKRPDIYGDACHVNYGEVESDDCTYGDTRSKRTLVLYGDSHAAQWFPALNALAKQNKLKLISLTKSACSAVDSKRRDQGAFKMADCSKWRENSIKRIAKIRPVAVITSSFAHFEAPGNYPSRAQWWSDGQRRLLQDLQGKTRKIIYIADTPQPLRDIPSCLASRKSSTCDSTKKTPVRIIRGFDIIDPTSWLCTSYCPAIVDGVVAYRDNSHISVDMSLSLISRLRAELSARQIF